MINGNAFVMLRQVCELFVKINKISFGISPHVDASVWTYNAGELTINELFFLLLFSYVCNVLCK